MPRRKTTPSKSPKPTYISPGLYPLVMDINDLIHDRDNVRLHDDKNLESIARSLEGFGQQKPIIIGDQGRVIAGNGTLIAARKLGWTHIAAVKTKLEGAAAKAFAIADNRTSDLSDFDQQALAQQLAQLQDEVDIDVLMTGFDNDEIQKLIDEAANMVGDINDNEPPQKEKDIAETFGILITCKNEREQEAMYKQMSDKGFTCKVLTM